MTLCSLIEVHQHLRRAEGYSLALEIEAIYSSEISTTLHGVVSKKTVLFTVTAVRTSNLEHRVYISLELT
jgi:hypothetical protein